MKILILKGNIYNCLPTSVASKSTVLYLLPVRETVPRIVPEAQKTRNHGGNNKQQVLRRVVRNESKQVYQTCFTMPNAPHTAGIQAV